MRCCIGPVIPSAWVNRIAWYRVSLNHTPSLIDAPGRATKRMAEEQKRTITLVWSRADTSKECRTGMLGKGTTCSVDVRCRYCDLRALMDASNDRHNLSKLLTHPGVNVGPPRCFLSVSQARPEAQSHGAALGASGAPQAKQCHGLPQSCSRRTGTSCLRRVRLLGRLGLAR
jgi:hypothetical protein